MSKEIQQLIDEEKKRAEEEGLEKGREEGLKEGLKEGEAERDALRMEIKALREKLGRFEATAMA